MSKKPVKRINKAGSYHLLELTQTEMAEWFGVDRTTVTQYQRDGMPFIRGGRGKANLYDAFVCLLWRMGRDQAKKKGLSRLPALTYILSAWLCGEREEDPLDWMPRARHLAERIDLPSDDAMYLHCLATAMNIAGHIR